MFSLLFIKMESLYKYILMSVIVLYITGKLHIVNNVFTFIELTMPSCVLIPVSSMAVEFIFDALERLFIF